MYLVPTSQPKAARIHKHLVYPLSLHVAAEELDESRPYSELKIAGQFSALDAHAWCSKLAEGGDREPPAVGGAMMFQHCMLNTCLHIQVGPVGLNGRRGWVLSKE